MEPSSKPALPPPDSRRRGGVGPSGWLERGRWLAAIAVPLLACGVQWLLWDYIQPYVWFLFFPAAYFCAYLGGLRSGLVSTVISALLVWYVFMPPGFSFAVQKPSSVFSIVVFVGMGALFGVAHERLAKARRQSAEALGLAEQRTREAEEANRRLAEEVAARVRVEKDAERQAAELTERRAHEREIERWARLYAALSQINQAIVRVKSHDELAREVARATIECGGFRLAWIGRYQAATRAVVPLGGAGEPQEFVHRFRHGSDGDAGHRCPCGPAIREDRAYVVNDLADEPEMPEWQAAMAAAGIRAAGVFPIRVRGAFWGVFGAYAGEAGVFQDKETALLEQAALDIGYAVENLDNEAQRRQAEEALRHSEARRTLALDAAQAGTWEWELATGKNIWSDELWKLYGLEPHSCEPSYETWRQTVHPEDRAAAEQALQEIIGREGELNLEWRVLVPATSERWLMSRGRPLRDAAGRVVRYLGVVMDISERKQVETELVRTRNTLLEAQRIAQLGSFEYVAATRTTVWSEEEYRIYGLDPAEPSPAYDDMLARCIHPADTALLHETFTKAMQGEAVYELEHRIVRPDGSVRWVYDRAHPYFDPQGKLVRYVGTTLDITERKQAQAELRRWADAFENCAHGIALGLPETNQILACNPAFARMVSRPATEIAGRPILSVYDPADHDRIKAHIAEADRVGHVCYEAHMMHAAGSAFPVQMDVVSVRDASGKVLYRVATAQDITARKQAEGALRKSEEMYRSLFENMLNGFAYCRMIFEEGQPKDFLYLRVNANFEKLTGLRNVEGRKISEVVPGIRASDPTLFEVYGRVANTGQPERFETFVEALNDWYAVSVYSPQKEYFVAVFDVVTERKRAELALRESELLLEEVGRVARIGGWEFDPASGNVKWTKAVALIHELPPETNMTVASGLEFYPADSRRRMEAAVRGAIEEHEPYDLEVGFLTATGEPKWARVIGRPVVAEGKVVKVRGSFQDITEHKRAEEALRASETEFRSLAEAMPQIVWATRPDGWNIYFNRQWTDYTGLTLEESHGHGWNQPFHPEDQQRAWDAWQRATQHRDIYSLECRLRRADGTYRWWLIRGVPYCNEQGEIVKWFGTCTDIDDLRRAADEIRQLNANLEQRVRERTAQLETVNKELEMFSYSVSHDLRAPLRHVQGFVGMLERELGGGLSERGARLLKTIASASQEMGVLIDELLEFSRMSRQGMQDTSVPLDKLVQEVQHRLDRSTTGRKVVWRIGSLPTVRGDPAMLRQALANLLENAVKYTRTRDVAEIEVGSAGREGDRAILRVRDNGVGFDPQYAHKLFGVFQRLHNSSEFEGIGIGLASVHRIITRHGGRVWAESQPDQGATFFFTLKSDQPPEPAHE